MDLGGWLRSLGLGQYEAAFRKNEIDASLLPPPGRRSADKAAVHHSIEMSLARMGAAHFLISLDEFL